MTMMPLVEEDARAAARRELAAELRPPRRAETETALQSTHRGIQPGKLPFGPIDEFDTSDVDELLRLIENLSKQPGNPVE